MVMAPAPPRERKKAEPYTPHTGMASVPKSMNVSRNQVTDETTEQHRALRRTMRALHWNTGKQLLDLLQMSCDTDRRWEIARKQALDIINQGEEAQVRAIGQILGQAQDKDEDDG